MTSSALADQGSPRSFTQFLSLPRTTTSSLYMPLPTTFSPRRSMKWCCCATEPERERTWERNTNCDSLLALHESRESLSYCEQRATLLLLQRWVACHRYYIDLFQAGTRWGVQTLTGQSLHQSCEPDYRERRIFALCVWSARLHQVYYVRPETTIRKAYRARSAHVYASELCSRSQQVREPREWQNLRNGKSTNHNSATQNRDNHEHHLALYLEFPQGAVAHA